MMTRCNQFSTPWMGSLDQEAGLAGFNFMIDMTHTLGRILTHAMHFMYSRTQLDS